MHPVARATKLTYISIYISLYMKTFLKTGVFEPLARYTMRYQESNLHLGLYSSFTSANNHNLNLNLLTSSSRLNPYSPLPLLTYNSNSNGFYSQRWTCLGWNKNKVN